MGGDRQRRPAHPAAQPGVSGHAPESLSPLLDALARGDDEAAESAVADLLQKGAASPEIFLPLLESPDPEARWWALRALGEVPHPRAFAALLEALRAPEPEIRQCAALGLLHHARRGLEEEAASQAVAALVPLLEGRDRLLASLARDALASVGARAVPALLETLQEGTPAARLEAMRALARIGDQRALPAMFAALTEDDTALLQHWAEEGLEKMGVGMVFFKPGG